MNQTVVTLEIKSTNDYAFLAEVNIFAEDDEHMDEQVNELKSSFNVRSVIPFPSTATIDLEQLEIESRSITNEMEKLLASDKKFHDQLLIEVGFAKVEQ